MKNKFNANPWNGFLWISIGLLIIVISNLLHAALIFNSQSAISGASLAIDSIATAVAIYNFCYVLIKLINFKKIQNKSHEKQGIILEYKFVLNKIINELEEEKDQKQIIVFYKEALAWFKARIQVKRESQEKIDVDETKIVAILEYVIAALEAEKNPNEVINLCKTLLKKYDLKLENEAYFDSLSN